MSAKSDVASRPGSGGVRVQRLSLRRLEFRSSLPRYVLYTVAVVAIVRSLAGIAAPRHTAVQALRPAGIDVATAGYAVSFARAYLSYYSSNPGEREAALARFVSGGMLDRDAGFTAPSSGSQQVSFAQVVADRPDGSGAHVYTVQADASRLGTVYLAVTVTHGEGGALELVGEPALVGPPASGPAVADSSQANDPSSDPGVTQVVTRAITNYLRDDSPDLQSDLAAGVSVSLPQIAFEGIQVSRIAWQHPRRVVGVDVQASDQAGGVYSLHYELSVTRKDRWYVTGIESTSSSGG